MDRTTGTLLLALEESKYTDEYLATIREIVPDMNLLVTTDRNAIKTHRHEIEIAAGHVPSDIIASMTNLRWLQQWFAGADWLQDHPPAIEHDFVLTNASGVHAIPITEHIFALMLAFGRHVHTAVRLQEKHKWLSPDWDDIFELADKTMLLIGVGAIGARTADVAEALGMKVIGIRRTPSKKHPSISTMHPPDDLHTLLPEADFVVLTVPATPETVGMIGENELQTMKRSAIIVNIGRGETIDQAALIKALQKKWIAGAGLDVLETEPPASDSPLWDMDNVIITAHYAGKTPRYDERAFDIFLDNLRRYRDDVPLQNVVDKELGY